MVRIGHWYRNHFPQFLTLLPVLACGLFVGLQPGIKPPWPAGLRLALVMLVCLPYFLMGVVSWRLHVFGRQGFKLQLRKEEQSNWPNTERALLQTWGYERDRFRRSLLRARQNAQLFGALATISFSCCVLLVAWRDWQVAGTQIVPMALSVVAATATVFLVRFVEVLVRLSGQDISARMFTWATRSLMLGVIADVGLFLVFFPAPGQGIEKPILLGILAGAMGDRAIDFLLDKAATAFGLKKSEPIAASPLLGLSGVTEEHVRRLQEEGVTSIHDFAFVPTARLFFNTAYSLQQICDWQDQALLHVYVGPTHAKALAEQMAIRGAIDLRFAARRALGEGNAHAEEVKNTREALTKALGVDPKALEAELRTLHEDEVTMRVGLCWQGAVSEPAEVLGEDLGDRGGPREGEAAASHPDTFVEVTTH